MQFSLPLKVKRTAVTLVGYARVSSTGQDLGVQPDDELLRGNLERGDDPAPY
jgi:hypothetical protein